VSALGLGDHHLGDLKTVDEAIRLVHEAVDGGITFYDNCWDYWNGRAEAVTHRLYQPMERRCPAAGSPLVSPNHQRIPERRDMCFHEKCSNRRADEPERVAFDARLAAAGPRLERMLQAWST
jgi:hypothetical protein